jgi:hypothetical protein
MKKLIEAIVTWISSIRPTPQTLIFVVVTGVFLVYLAHEITNQVEVTPCSPTGHPAQCYNITQQMCEVIWAKSENSCKEFIQKLSLPAGRLGGPIQFNCQWTALDKAFAASRSSNPECKELFKELEGWQRRNDFK